MRTGRPRAAVIAGSLVLAGADVHENGRAYGTIVARKRHAAGSTPHQVTLRPGGTASFGFSHRDYARGAHCDLVTGARVYDPDGSGYRTTATSFDECEGIRATGLLAVPVVVGPFVAGSRASLA